MAKGKEFIGRFRNKDDQRTVNVWKGRPPGMLRDLYFYMRRGSYVYIKPEELHTVWEELG